jgi:2-aminoadipate transaminase
VTTIQFSQIVVPPGMIELGIGQPDRSTFPVEALQSAATRAFDSAGEYLQYGAEYGDGHHRLALADFLTRAYGFPVDAELLYSSNGNSQAIDQISGTFSAPGDTIIVEDPTYFLARQIFADRHLHVVGAHLDADGIDVDALGMQLADLRSAGTPARFIYTIPTFHNPTGLTLPTERREQLVQLATRNNCLIVADEVYHLLQIGHTGESALLPPPMSAWVDSGHVLSMGTFSKIFSPGLRLGWIHGAPPLLERLVNTGLILSAGGLNPVVSTMMTPLLRDGSVEHNIAALRREYAMRIDVMDSALREHLGGLVTWTKPSGGYFFWVTLPPGVDGLQLRRIAEQHGVGLRQGALFRSAPRHGPDSIRLSFAHYQAPDLIEGCRRLGVALRQITSLPAL